MTRQARALGTILEGIPVKAIHGDSSCAIRDVVHDSRRVSPGDLYVALPGSKVDGHDFVAAARTQGAAAVVVERQLADLEGLCQVVVDDARRVLPRLAANLYGDPSQHFVLIGITGTNGKTTLTYLLEHVLKQTGARPGVIGTVNVRYEGQTFDNPHTTPEAPQLQRWFADMRDAGVSHVIMEVSSHALVMERVRASHFDVAVFTNLSRDHLDFHTDMETYAQAKALLFGRELVESQAGAKVAVLNQDDPWAEVICGGFDGERIGFGLDSRARVHPKGQVHYSLEGFETQVALDNEIVALTGRLTGRHNLQNALAALAVCRAIGIPATQAAQGIASCTHVPGRLEPVLSPKGPAVFVDYAHTDGALDNVLPGLRQLCPGRLIVVFGCGGDRDRGKRPLMGAAVARHAHLALVTSDNPRSEDPAAIVEAILPGLEGGGMQRVTHKDLSDREAGAFAVEIDRARAIELAIQAARPGDVVLIAGKGHETYQIIGSAKTDFDDRQVARVALARRQAGETCG